MCFILYFHLSLVLRLCTRASKQHLLSNFLTPLCPAGVCWAIIYNACFFPDTEYKCAFVVVYRRRRSS